MSFAYVIEKRCPQDHPCPALPHCPTGAIIQHEYDAPKVVDDKCIACEKCIKVCPKGAFQLKI